MTVSVFRVSVTHQPVTKTGLNLVSHPSPRLKLMLSVNVCIFSPPLVESIPPFPLCYVSYILFASHDHRVSLENFLDCLFTLSFRLQIMFRFPSKFPRFMMFRDDCTVGVDLLLTFIC